jgi:hypothetical protein
VNGYPADEQAPMMQYISYVMLDNSNPDFISGITVYTGRYAA